MPKEQDELLAEFTGPAIGVSSQDTVGTANSLETITNVAAMADLEAIHSPPDISPGDTSPEDTSPGSNVTPTDYDTSLLGPGGITSPRDITSPGAILVPNATPALSPRSATLIDPDDGIGPRESPLVIRSNKVFGAGDFWGILVTFSCVHVHAFVVFAKF